MQPSRVSRRSLSVPKEASVPLRLPVLVLALATLPVALLWVRTVCTVRCEVPSAEA